LGAASRPQVLDVVIPASVNGGVELTVATAVDANVIQTPLSILHW
jgi:hypothetical protein